MAKNNHVYLKSKNDQRDLFLRAVYKLEERKPVIDGKFFNSRLSDYLNSSNYLKASWKIFNEDMEIFQERNLKDPKKFYDFVFSIKNDVRHKWDLADLKKVLKFVGLKSTHYIIETEPYVYKLTTKYDHFVNTCWNFYFSGDTIRENSQYISNDILFVSRGILFFNEYSKASLLVYDFFWEKYFFFLGNLEESIDEDNFCFRFESEATKIKLDLVLSFNQVDGLHIGYLKRLNPLIIVMCCIEKADKPYIKSTLIGHEFRNFLPMQNYYVAKHIERFFDKQNLIKLKIENFIIEEQKQTIEWIESRRKQFGMIILPNDSGACRIDSDFHKKFLKSKMISLEDLKKQKSVRSYLDANFELLKDLIGLTILREDI